MAAASEAGRRSHSLPDPPGAPPDPESATGAGGGGRGGGGGGGGGLLDGPRCRSLCTARACCQLLQLLLCLLVLACAAVSAGPPGGYTGLLDLGGAHYYAYGGAYSGFGGADGERARRLDAEFGRLKLPPARGAAALGGALAALPALQLGAALLGLPPAPARPAWLLAEALLAAAAAGAGLLPGAYFFYRALLAAYGSPVCAERERLYHGKGYRGFGCAVHGAEVAAGVFAGGAALAFLLGAALALRAFRTARERRGKAAAAAAAAAPPAQRWA